MMHLIYYVTWNADYYLIHITVIIKLRYLILLGEDLVFILDKIKNNYGYIPLKIHREWL
jgi:hypothetical protein